MNFWFRQRNRGFDVFHGPVKRAGLELKFCYGEGQMWSFFTIVKIDWIFNRFFLIVASIKIVGVLGVFDNRIRLFLHPFCHPEAKVIP